MKCTHCGFESQASDCFCEQCGAVLVHKAETLPEKRASFNKKTVLIVAAVLCVIAIMLGGTILFLCSEKTGKEDAAYTDGNQIHEATIADDLQYYAEYLRVIEKYEKTYGEIAPLCVEPNWHAHSFEGLMYAKLVDFNRDGTDELVLVYNRSDQIYDRVMEIWAVVDGKVSLVEDKLTPWYSHHERHPSATVIYATEKGNDEIFIYQQPGSEYNQIPTYYLYRFDGTEFTLYLEYGFADVGEYYIGDVSVTQQELYAFRDTITKTGDPLSVSCENGSGTLKSDLEATKEQLLKAGTTTVVAPTDTTAPTAATTVPTTATAPTTATTVPTTASSKTPLALDDQDRYDINIFLSNFSEQHFSESASFAVSDENVEVLVEFAYRFNYINRYSTLDQNTFVQNGIPYVYLTLDDINRDLERFFGRSVTAAEVKAAMPTTEYRFVTEDRVCWAQASGASHGSFTLIDEMVSLGNGLYQVEFTVYVFNDMGGGNYIEDDAVYAMTSSEAIRLPNVSIRASGCAVVRDANGASPYHLQEYRIY